MENAIEVKNLSKKFTHYPSQRDRFIDMATGGRAKRGTDFWALKDISFDVPKGTTFGIIGQNGSGKSTLLSILAGVLQPTSGTFTVNGKVAAILELGSGFHHEFTGRENVYMYGTILGLSRLEIDRRLDEIIDFSELHEFIDRPLYTYSSGMVARLAFAAAINVDADIIIIDEALAVGDALFQQRCLKKIRQLQEEGKTILYVGHDFEAVRAICSKSILVDNGLPLMVGEANDIVNYYSALLAKRCEKYIGYQDNNEEQNDLNECEMNIFEGDRAVCSGKRWGTRLAEIFNVEMLNEYGKPTLIFKSGENTTIRIHIRALENIDNEQNVGFVIRNKFSEVYGMNTHWLNVYSGHKKKGDVWYVDFKQCLHLGVGTYTIAVAIAIIYSPVHGQTLDWINDIYSFKVISKKQTYGCVNLKSVAVVQYES